MKRITNIAFFVFSFAVLLWLYYSNNEALARRFPNDLLFWEYAAQYSGIVLLTLVFTGFVQERRVGKRMKNLANSGIEFIQKPDGNIVSMRPIR